MIIKKITIELGPSPKEGANDNPPPNRVLKYDRETRKWYGHDIHSDEASGLHPGEIRLIAAIDEVRGNHQL